MKILLYTKDPELINKFMALSKDSGEDIDLLYARTERGLFESLNSSSLDLFLMEAPSEYSRRAIDMVKRKSPYTPVALFGLSDQIRGIPDGDIYLPYNGDSPEDLFYLSLINARTYLKSFESLRKLTTKISEAIVFDECKYDPTRRTLYHKNKEVKKLSDKQGGILEILAVNFGRIVKKEVILEKVWRKSDYFAGRSMDVYLTHLRQILKENQISLSIKNISGVGIILE